MWYADGCLRGQFGSFVEVFIFDIGACIYLIWGLSAEKGVHTMLELELELRWPSCDILAPICAYRGGKDRHPVCRGHREMVGN